MTVDESQFEQPLIEIREKIEELEGYPEGAGHRKELVRLRKQLDKTTREVYVGLTPWQTTLVARHADRPHTLDFVAMLTEDFVELKGDRNFADDGAIVAGLATYHGRSVAIVGHEKGRGTKERITRNFGQPRPEGYRKALRVMKLAERFQLPVISLVDTPGAYPGKGAEERGQHEAVARNLIEMAALQVPIVTVVTGEGGSGGALALGVANRVLMLEYGVYSVITPEGCAAILWKDQERRADAAAAMKVTSRSLLEYGIIDEIIPEPLGGAHADPAATAEAIDRRLEPALAELSKLTGRQLVEQRYERFRRLGVFEEQR